MQTPSLGKGCYIKGRVRVKGLSSPVHRDLLTRPPFFFLTLEVTQPSKFGEQVTKGGPAEANASRTWGTFQNTCVQETLSTVDIPRRHPGVRRIGPPFQLGSHPIEVALVGKAISRGTGTGPGLSVSKREAFDWGRWLTGQY